MLLLPHQSYIESVVTLMFDVINLSKQFFHKHLAVTDRQVSTLTKTTIFFLKLI